MIRSRAYCSSHLVVLFFFCIFFQSACTHQRRPMAASAPPPIDFLEFKPGSTVQVVVPLTRSGSYVLPSIRKQKANDFEIHAGDDFIGYQKATYKVSARRDGGVQVHFTRATDWQNGKSSTIEKAKLTLFEDLTAFRYFRLLFLTRESQADHNMAIVAAMDPGSLQSLTASVVERAVCGAEVAAICRWVPEGVAVTVDSH